MQGRQKARKGQRRTAKANEDRKAGRSMPERENNKQNTETKTRTKAHNKGTNKQKEEPPKEQKARSNT